MNESLLWDRVKAGDQSAFADVYNLHVNALYNYGNRIFQNSTLVEDGIHDLFVDLWNSRKNLSPIKSIRAYLYASLRRKIVKTTKKTSLMEYDSKWGEMHLLTHSEEEKVIEKEHLDEQTTKLRKNLNNLAPRQYEAIVLKYYDQLSYAEIAAIMDVNEQSVRNLIQRGIDKLRQFAQVTIALLILLFSYLYF